MKKTTTVSDIQAKEVTAMEYVPAPIDTGGIRLTPEIMELCEMLAKNTHDVWAETRIKDGWTYGSERNDALKKHPCLVPYEDLSEAEKEYDRNTSVETLKLIIKMGFTISKGYVTENDC